MELNDLKAFIKEVHQVAKDHGWHDAPSKTDLECMMLMVSEVAEAVEEIRKGIPPNKTYVVNGKPEGTPVELADVLLRVFDYAESRNIDLVEAMLLKHEYNKSRPYKHGKVL